MKNQTLWKLSLRLALIILPLANGCARQELPPPTTLITPAPAAEYALAPAQTAAPEAAPTPSPATSPVAAPATNILDAPAVPLSADQTPPPNVRTNGPLADIIKLAHSGVDQAVLLAFITNSTSPFNLKAEEIIYLNDLGLPSNVVTAILQHDLALKELPANPPPPTATEQLAPEPVAPAASAQAPQPPPPTDLSPETYAPPSAEATDSMFYDSLAPYGTWLQVEGYGPCWQPSTVVVNPSWQPYFDGGHWVYSDCGWYWLSDYSWGWAPFHYGRWFHHQHWGWCWRPDPLWAPSWVSWRYTDGYCGWAPLPPGARFSPGIGLTFQGRHVDASFSFGLGFDCFAFVPWGHFYDHHLRLHGVPHDRREHIYRQSTLATRFHGDSHIVSNQGLSPEHVASLTHIQVRPIALHEQRAPAVAGLRAERLAANGRTLSVFRPSPAELAAARNFSTQRARPFAQPRLAAPTFGRPTPSTAQAPQARPAPGTSSTAQRTSTYPIASPHQGADQRRQPPTATAKPPQTQSPWLTSRTAQPATGPQRPAYAPWQENRRLPAPDRRENSRPGYQLPAQRESRVPTYQPPAQVPRYGSAPAARPRYDPAPINNPPHTYSPPARSAPAAPAAPSAPPSSSSGSGSHSRPDRGRR